MGQGAVWIQCTTKYVAGDGQSDFGIQEIDLLDDQGRFQTQSFADASSPFGSLLARLYVDIDCWVSRLRQVLSTRRSRARERNFARRKATLFGWADRRCEPQRHGLHSTQIGGRSRE